MLVKSADDIKVEEIANILENRIWIKTDHNKYEHWSKLERIKLNV